MIVRKDWIYKMNFLDLFSGIGGFRLGAEWAGLKFENEFHSDIDNYANKVYAKRFPESISLGDITKIKAEDLLKYGNEWIITGGFPCQDISIAGKGAGITGARSGLWFEYWRLIRDLRPRIAIMENVGMLIHRGLREVLGSLAEIGYNAEWQDIRAEDMGAPHRRERIWIVAYPQSDNNKRDTGKFQKSNEQQETERQEKRFCKSGNASKINNGEFSNATGAGFQDRTIKENKSERISKQSERCNWWTTEPELGRLAHGIPHRVDRLKCLGNSIVPQIAYLLFDNLIEG